MKRGDDGGMDVTAVQALRTETEKAETGLGKEIVIWAHDEQVYEAAPRTGRRERHLLSRQYVLQSLQGFRSAGRTEWQLTSSQNYRRIHFEHCYRLKTQQTDFTRLSGLYTGINPSC